MIWFVFFSVVFTFEINRFYGTILFSMTFRSLERTSILYCTSFRLSSSFLTFFKNSFRPLPCSPLPCDSSVIIRHFFAFVNPFFDFLSIDLIKTTG